MKSLELLCLLLALDSCAGDLCDICRRKRNSAIRLPYNQLWFFDLSAFLCQPFNFCDDEITEQMKGRKTKQEISCDGMDCFEWLYKSLQRRGSEEGTLPRTMLKHHPYKKVEQVQASSTAVPSTRPTSPARTTTLTTLQRQEEEAELLGELNVGFGYVPNKPEVVHVVLEKSSVHSKPAYCSLNPDRGRRWPCSQRWYYNVAFGECRTFTFCGKKGNQNNFMSNASCYEECHGKNDVDR